MKKLIAVLMILMLITPAAGAESDYLMYLKKASYDINAIFVRLPTIDEAVEIQQDTFYWPEKQILVFFMSGDEESVYSWIIGCSKTANAKADDFLTACTCVIKILSNKEDETVLFGELLNLYINCRKGYGAKLIEHGSLGLMMEEENGNITFAIQVSR